MPRNWQNERKQKWTKSSKAKECKKPKKTAAQRMREYRERLKAAAANLRREVVVLRSNITTQSELSLPEIDCGFLISEVLSKEALWNANDKDYCNRRITGNLWEIVAEKMGCSVDNCKKKWKGLRDKYRIELKKEHEVIKNCVEDRSWTSSWKYFSSMSFLRQNLSPSEKSANLERADPKSPKSTEINEIFYMQDESLQESLPDQDFSEENNDFTTKSSKRKVTTEFRRKFLDLEEKKTILLQEMGQTIYKDEEESDDLLFFKSVLGYMTDLSKIAKLRIRNKVTTAIMEEVALNSRMSASYSGETYSNTTSTHQIYTETFEIASINPEDEINTYTLSSSHNDNPSLLSPNVEQANCEVIC